MATIKKPKPKKLPKKPKASASIDTMTKYIKKVNEVKKANKKAETDYKKAVKKTETLKKKIANL